MAKIDLSKYGITGATEIVYNPSYELLFEEETSSKNEGYEVGKESELGAPTSPPSISGWAKSSAALEALTLPP